MASDREVKVTFRVSDDGTLNVLDSAGTKLRTVGRAADELGSRGAAGFGKFAASIITANQAIDLASRAMHALRSGLGLVIDAADESDRAVLRLNTALQGSGQYTAAYSTALQDVATRLQGVTTYSDEAILGLEQFLVTAGVKGPQQIEQFSRAVLGLAEFLGKDLGQATMAMSGMLGGNFTMMERALRPLGVRFAENTSNAEKYSVIMGKLVPLFSYATAGATTFSGRIAQMRNIVGDLLEPIGKVITQSSAWGSIFGTLRAEIEGLTARTTAWVEANRSLIDESIASFFTNLPTNVNRAASAMATLAEKTAGWVSKIGTVVGWIERHPVLAATLGGAAIGAPAGPVGLAIGAVGGMASQLHYGPGWAGVTSGGSTTVGSVVSSQALTGVSAVMASGVSPWAFRADPNATKTAADTAKKALEEQQKDTLALMQAEETRRTIAVASAEFAAKAAKERGASYAEQIELAGALDAAEMHVLETQRDQAYLAVAQAIEAGKGAGEVERLAAEWQQVDAAIDRGATHTRELTDEARKAAEELSKAQHVTISLGDSLQQGAGRAIEGLFASGKGINVGAVMKDAATSMATEFATGLLKAELAKGQFDQKVSENFSVTLPGFMKTGAATMTNIWAGLFDGLGHITESGFGGMLGAVRQFVAMLGGALRSVPGLGQVGSVLSTLGVAGGGAWGAGQAVPISDVVGGIGLAVPSAAVRSTGLLGILGRVGGGAFAGAGAGALTSSLFGGGTVGNVLGGLVGGGLGGAMIGGQIGMIGGPLGAGIGAGLGALIGGLMSLFGGSAGPTQEHVNMDSIREWTDKSGVTKSQGWLGGRSAWGDHSIIDRVFGGITPGTAGAGTLGGLAPTGAGLNAILAVMLSGFGGNEQGIAGMGTNAFANNMALLGRTAEQAAEDLRDMASAAGVDLKGALNAATEFFRQGNASAEDYRTTIEQLTGVFSEDIPDALDTAAIAQKHFIDGILDASGYVRALQQQTKTFGLYQSAQQTYEQAYLSTLSTRRARAYQLGQLSETQAQLATETDPGKRNLLLSQMSDIGQWLMQQGGRRWQQMGLGVLRQVSEGYEHMLDLKPPIDENTKAIIDNTQAVKDLTDATKQIPPGVNVDITNPNIDWSTIDWTSPQGQEILRQIIPQNIWAGVPYMHAGGMVTRPTLTVVGDRGPEAVIPLSQMRGGDSQLADAVRALAQAVDRIEGGITVNADIDVEGVEEPRQAAELTVQQLILALKDFRARRVVRDVAING